MAKNESDREDLMKEAVSLVKRIECWYPTRVQPIIIGFNALGWLFVYIGSDPMYRFDEFGRLRRAFVDGKLFRTSGHTLAALVRERTSEAMISAVPSVSVLRRCDLSQDELSSFRGRMRTDIEEVMNGLGVGDVTRQHPTNAVGLILEIQQRLKIILNSHEFLAPPIVRR